MILRIVKFFQTGPFSWLLIMAALLAGAIALAVTPREEDPQIVVPMADVEVSFPGHSPAEVEQLVTRPLERILWQLDGIEHVYSQSFRDGALVTARFYVGEDRDRAMVRLRDKVEENRNIIPDGVDFWRIRPVSINDVAIVSLTLTSETLNPAQLRRVAEELAAELDSIADISKAEIIGGYPRLIRIEPDLAMMAAHNLSLPDLALAVRKANVAGTVGRTITEGQEKIILTEPALTTAADVAHIVIKGGSDRLVRLGDVAQVIDGPGAPEYYVRHLGRDAVTLAFSKKEGVNSVSLAREIIAKAERAKGTVIPDDVTLTVTRDQGQAADDRVNELVRGMFFAVITVILLIAVSMGWRESLVVGLSVPVSFALALFTNYIFGYTLNRVTLFALILSLGLVVDDPIINVDNIQRHIRLGKKKPFEATLEAVSEVLPPVIMSTVAVIISFAPMFFITGMMGPYMAPMAINVPLTVIFSTVCALTFVPFLARKLLEGRAGELSPDSDGSSPLVAKLYAKLLSPFFKRRNAFILLAVVAALVVGSAALMLLGVPLKMLPFDNRNELQLITKLPPGSTLEDSSRLVADLESFVARQNEVTNYQSYIGLASPLDFNGLVRHYDMRRQPHQADMRLNLLPKNERAMSSHALALRLRPEIEAIAERHKAIVNIVEIPPGPPVLASIIAEVYAAPGLSYDELIAGANLVKERLRQTDPVHLKELDLAQDLSPAMYKFKVDSDKAALNGLSSQEITYCLNTALSGAPLGGLSTPYERQQLPLKLRLALADRNDWSRLETLSFKGTTGSVPMAELGTLEKLEPQWPVMRKNLRPVVMVKAEPVGSPPGELILATQFKTLAENPLPPGISVKWAGEGEWEITLRVFRDLGLAFGAAMIGILLLLVVQTRSFKISFVMMGAIPLTLIGIAPGFWILNLIASGKIGGYDDPVFFTATGMIGMIALGGIVIRNSIVLIEFIQESRREGLPLHQALLASGAVRFRPIMLTAITTLMGAWPITLDPIFSGLAWALIFGLIASTMFTLIVIPTIYALIEKDGDEVHAQ